MRRFLALLLAVICLVSAAAAEADWRFEMDGAQWGMAGADIALLMGVSVEEIIPMRVSGDENDAVQVPLDLLDVWDREIYGCDADVSYVFADDELRMLVYDMVPDADDVDAVRAGLTAEYGEPQQEFERLYGVMDAFIPGMYTEDSFAGADCWELPDGTLLYFVNYANKMVAHSDNQYVMCGMDYAGMAAALGIAVE